MNSIYKKIAFKITILFLCILIVAATGAVFHFNYVYRQDTEDNLTRETKMISRLIQSSDDLASLTDYRAPLKTPIKSHPLAKELGSGLIES